MKTRFLKSALKTAAETEVVMPFARGARRAAFIAKRAAAEAAAKPRKTA